jgi:chromatin remodeling complex protein RSC6
MTTEQVDEKPMTTVEKFDLLIKDMNAHMDTAKSLSARMKVLQKEVSKSSRGKRSQKSPASDDPDAPKKVSALQKPVAISDELCVFLGFEPKTDHCRQEVTSCINAFVKTHELQDPKNRRFILLEGSEPALKLKKLLRDPDQPVTFFNIQRYLKPHYPPSLADKAKTEAVAEKLSAVVNTPQVVPDTVHVEDDPDPPTTKNPVKKRVVRNPKV